MGACASKSPVLGGEEQQLPVIQVSMPGLLNSACRVYSRCYCAQTALRQFIII